jgi:hypothetical protein
MKVCVHGHLNWWVGVDLIWMEQDVMWLYEVVFGEQIERRCLDMEWRKKKERYPHDEKSNLIKEKVNLQTIVLFFPPI